MLQYERIQILFMRSLIYPLCWFRFW